MTERDRCSPSGSADDIAQDGQRAQEEAGNQTVEVEVAEGMIRVEGW